MPEWLIIVLFVMVFGVVNYLAFRFGRAVGYDAGYHDCLKMGEQLDTVLRSKHGPPARPGPGPPRPPQLPPPPTL